MEKSKLIVANWKMNCTVQEALKFLTGFQREIHGLVSCEVVFCPPFTALYPMEEALEGTTFKLGAQNMHWEEAGAFTGEISPHFLKEMNVRYVILGHSERRGHFGETDAMINKKLAQALNQHLTPIVCVGETEKEHADGKTFEIVERQMKMALDGQNRSELGMIVWAYEPVWAIGTGKNATPEQAQEVLQQMRRLVAKAMDAPTAEKMWFLYGGSVSAEKAAAFLKKEGINGLLVGGASLDPKKFGAIVRACDMPH